MCDRETHHICPKANDLFPEYKSFKLYKWNKIKLSYRQHFIAHWLLWKAYGGSQTIAFSAMQNQNSNRDKIVLKSSKIFEKLRKEAYLLMSIKNKGYAVYIDKNGNKIRCLTTEQRVLSRELVSTSHGRQYAHRSNDSRERTSLANKGKHFRKISIDERMARRTTKNHTKLYFNPSTNEFKNFDKLLVPSGWIYVGANGIDSKPIFDIHGNMKRINKNIPIPPPNWYFENPTRVIRIFNLSNHFYEEHTLLTLPKNVIRMTSPLKDGFTFVFCTTLNKIIKLNKFISDQYGMPKNCDNRILPHKKKLDHLLRYPRRIKNI
jgi:hypothetical protein